MLFIHSIGHFHPENIIDNQLLESLDIGTTEQWILQRCGIQSRRTVLPIPYILHTRNKDPRAADEASLYSNAETGYYAAQMALERSGLKSSDIGMVIAGGSAPRIGSPAEACTIAARLGITAPSFDLNSACSTFAVQMRMIAMMDADSLPEFILVANPENLTRTVNYDDRAVAILFGDGTTAAVVSRKIPGRALVTKSFMESEPASWQKVVIPAAGHLTQDGSAVQNFAIRRTVTTIQNLSPYCSPNPYFVGHQANLMMLRSACSRAGVPEDRHLFNVHLRGNCGSAGAPSVISERWDQFRPGDEVLMAVVGAGLTWAGLVLQFGECN